MTMTQSPPTAMMTSHQSFFHLDFNQPAYLHPAPSTMLIPPVLGQQMIGQHILFKWPTYGWCLGKIAGWNSDFKRTVSKQIVNCTVFYPDDCSSGPHSLTQDHNNSLTHNDSQTTHGWCLNPHYPNKQTTSNLGAIHTVSLVADLTSTSPTTHTHTSQRGMSRNSSYPGQKDQTIGSALLRGQHAHSFPQ